MPSSHDAEAATALLQEPVFAALAEEAVRDYIDWADLTTRPLPPGLSVLGTWRLLTTVRRFAATPFPIPDPKGRTYWYTLTREGLVCIETIERHCRADSAAHRAILHRHGHRFLVGSRIRETVAVCRLDGVVIATSEAESMLMGGRARTPESGRTAAAQRARPAVRTRRRGGRAILARTADAPLPPAHRRR